VNVRDTSRSDAGERSLLGAWIPKLGGWFFGGAIAMWFICGWLRSSSMLMEVVVPLVVTLGLLFVTKGAVFIGWAACIHQNQSEVLAGTAVAFAIYMALASGMVVGAVVHFLRRACEWWEENLASSETTSIVQTKLLTGAAGSGRGPRRSTRVPLMPGLSAEPDSTRQ
jgi:hypothetical protein